MKKITFNTLLLVIGLFATAALAQQPHRMQLEDLGRLVRVSDPQIAPDSKSIVIVVARSNYDENRYDTDLVLIDIASGKQSTLTHERRSISHPRFSPNGDRLALRHFIHRCYKGST